MRIIKAVLILVLLFTTGCLKISSTPVGTPAVNATSAPGDATKIAVETTQEGVVPTSTPEAAVTAKPQKVKWGNYTLVITSVVVDKNFPAGCTGEPPACTAAKKGKEIVSITFVPVNLAEGKELPYKKLPAGIIIANDKGKTFPKSLQNYNAENKNLTLGFVVPEGSKSFKFKWPGKTSMKLRQ
jgi:hypothetical protein